MTVVFLRLLQTDEIVLAAKLSCSHCENTICILEIMMTCMPLSGRLIFLQEEMCASKILLVINQSFDHLLTH